MGVFDEDGQEWTIERMLSQKITPENILEATKKIRPILSGLGPTHQCGVLADLVATWLAVMRRRHGPTYSRYCS